MEEESYPICLMFALSESAEQSIISECEAAMAALVRSRCSPG